MIYHLAHKGISENEMVNSLAKVAAKKATHLPPRIDITMSDINNANAPITIDKWGGRWANSKSHKYKELVPAICKNSLKHRLFQLKKMTTRRGLFKILQFKSGYCKLINHKSRINFETSPLCGVCQIKEIFSHYVL